MSESMQEKTEDATPRRRQEARKKGTVTRSMEVTNSLVMLALLVALPIAIEKLGAAMLLSINRGLLHMPLTADSGEMTRYAWTVASGPLMAFLPFIFVGMVVGVAANFAQVGFVLSGESLSPKFSKINPLTGLKRMFSAHAGMEGLKAIAKTALFGYLAYKVVEGHWVELMNLSWTTPTESAAVVGNVLRTIFMRIAIAWLVLAGLDYFFQRKQIDKQLKMTKDEVKQEYKQNEQSPELKMAMAQRRRQLLKGRMAQAVREADVIITNPTHFSIALKYDRDKMIAPEVVAKGADHLAFRIRELAKEAKVPIVPNPPLARQLYKKCEVGDSVPKELFQAVAEVLAYVYSTLKKVRSQAS